MTVSEAGNGSTSDAAIAGLPEIGAVVADKYRVDRVIGRGGMGAVFQATHLVTDKVVALKCMLPRQDLAPGNVDRFIREARAVARVGHPNIVDVYDVGEHDGTFFLVMEYLRGRSLREVMQRGPLPEGALLRSLLPAMRGVQAAHRRGVVHRDLKPENIFLCCDPDGELLEAKVLDFGISKINGQAGGGLHSITRTGAVMGTPFYMSPEQAEDSSTVDERTDIYSFGVILYEALAGELPYKAESLTALLLRITRGDALPLRKHRPELPGALEAAVMRAMARDPGKRFPDMPALIAGFEPFAGNTPLPVAQVLAAGTKPSAHAATPFSVETSPRRSSRARTFVVAGAFGLLLAIAAVLLWRTGLAPAPAPSPASAAAPSPPSLAPAPPPIAPAAVSVPEPVPVPESSASAPPNPRRKRIPRPAPVPAPAEPAPPAEPRAKGQLGIELQPDQF
jgi:serine/threonine-protein kinase